MGVSIIPGCTELTRIPSAAQCSAAFLVISRTAPLAAWYAGEVPNPPLAPKIDELLITDACDDSLSASAAVRIPRKTLCCVTAMVCR